MDIERDRAMTYGSVAGEPAKEIGLRLRVHRCEESIVERWIPAVRVVPPDGLHRSRAVDADDLPAVVGARLVREPLLDDPLATTLWRGTELARDLDGTVRPPAKRSHARHGDTPRTERSTV